MLRRAAMLVAFAGCIDPGSSTIDVPADVAVVALLTIDDGEVVRASALEPVDRSLPILAATDDELRIVGYGADVAASSEPLRVARGCDPALPAPRWYVDWSGDELAELDPTTAPPLTAAPPVDDCLATCRRFETETVVIDGSAGGGLVNFGMRVDADTVAIGSGGDAVYLVSRGGVVTSTVIDLGGPIIAAFNGPDESLWFVTTDGTVYTGTLDDLQVRSRGGLPSPKIFREKIVVDDPSMPTDLVGVTKDGVMARYDGATWRTIHEIDTPRMGAEVSVARVGPSESFVLGVAQTILHETPQGLVPAPLGAGGASVPSLLANVPGFGVLAVTNFARVYRWQGAWVELDEEPPIFGIPRVVVPFDDAFLVGGTAGVLTEYRFDGGYCEPLPLAPHRVQIFTKDRFGVVLYGGGSDQDFGVTFADVVPN